MKNIIGRLLGAVESHPDALLYAFLNGAGEIADSYTYRRLHERSNHVAASLTATGKVVHGQPVLLVYPPGLEFIVAFYACVKVGAIPVPVAPPESSGFVGGMEKLSGIAGDCGATVALATQAYLEHIEAGLRRHRETTGSHGAAGPLGLAWLPTDDLQGEQSDFDYRPNDLLFLQYTSGSTRAPRGVMVSHANVIANCAATLDHAPVGVSWLPHYHDMGLIGYYLFIMARAGRAYWFSGSHFLKRPLLWLETISRFRSTITSAPNFAFEYCLRDDKVPPAKLAGLDLSAMRCMMNASEPVRANTYERFLAKFGPCGLSPRALVVFYGLAENTLSVSGDGRVRVTVNTHLLEQNRLRFETPRADAYDQSRLVSCGRARPGVEVRVVDSATREALGEDLIGEVWLAGESKTWGYWNKSTLSREVFGATIADEPSDRTYLRTGDLGFLHDGELYICGRLKDMIIIGGRNFFPNDIEAAVEQASTKVRPGCVVAFAMQADGAEAIGVLAEAAKANDLPDLEEICNEVRKRCQVELHMLAIVPHGTIAKTSSGKVARQECRRRWHEGRVSVLARRDRAGADAGGPIAELLRRLSLGGEDDRTLADLGVDSLTLVELSLYLERLAGQAGLGDGAAYENLFDLRLLQAITVGELRSFLEKAAAGGALPKLAPQAYLSRLRAIESEETALMRKDALLPRDIRPDRRQGRGGPKVLLTGATGFLGSFLLEALLRLTDYEIVTIVRAQDLAHARNRMESALQRTGLWRESLREACALRVVPLPGDLTQPRLGLPEKNWDALAHGLSAVYHCGAEVDYVKPYHALRAANVGSTIEILRLAASGSIKALHYVSTTFIFGFVAREFCRESDRNEEMAGLNFGYSQTKWVSEHLVQQAAQQGVPTRIYRPSLVTASRMGRYVRRDLTARILAYMMRHGVSIDSANQVSFLPADVCANNVVALSLIEEPFGQSFHLTTDHYYTMQTVCRLIEERCGYSFAYMSLERLIHHMNENCTKDDPLFPLVAFFNHNFRRIDSMRDKRYQNDVYRNARARSTHCLPEPPLDETVGAIVSFLQAEHLAAAAPGDDAQAAIG